METAPARRRHPAAMSSPSPERGFGLHGRPKPPTVPYQVDYTTAKTGRHCAPTKRRVKWVFGLASIPHLGLGCTGPDCRGYEHEVLLLWSLTSGKRRVILDGKEVHYSVAGHTVQKFAVAFPLPGEGNHMLQLLAYASPPLGSKADPNFRQFDLRLDGQPFAEMIKMYELGGDKCRRTYEHAYAYAQSMPREELEEAAAGIRTARTPGGGAIRRKVPDAVMQQYEDDTYVDPDDADFDHLNPHSPSEENLMFEFARQKSLRDTKGAAPKSAKTRGGTADSAGGGGGAGGERQIPDFDGVHNAFKLPPPRPSPSRHQRSRPGQKKQASQQLSTVSEQSTDLIDLSSVAPSQQQQSPFQRDASSIVQRIPSDLTVNPSDYADNVSRMGDDDASSVGGWGVGPQMPPGPSGASFAYAPPPTWEQANAAFAPTATTTAGSVAAGTAGQQTDASFAAQAFPNPPGSGASFAFAPPPTWEQMNDAFAPASPSFATSPTAAQPPPSVVGGVSAAAPVPTSDASSFAAYYQAAPPPVPPSSGPAASFAYAPPPTLEQMNAAFAPQPAQTQWQQQPQQQQGAPMSPQGGGPPMQQQGAPGGASANPFDPNFGAAGMSTGGFAPSR